MPIASMTGFARAEGADPTRSGTTCIWEVRSVNGKGLETRWRIPPGYDGLEIAVREAVAKRLKRGNVSVTLTVSGADEQPSYRVNEALLDQIMDAARRWQIKTGDVAGVQMPRLDGLLALKGVLEQVGEEEPDAQAREARDAALIAVLDDALVKLAQARADEGARMETVLVGHLDTIADLVEQAAGTAALRPEAVKARLREQVAALVDAQTQVSEDRLAQELALLAVKGDVREELDRLRAHIAQARELIAADKGPVGRRLDFLCQEFNREANTLCSKAQDVALTRIGLELKAVIDQFREQVQNIE
ncbi:YicC/YloC family endoribonuclease [Caenispirillum salinarum]|uniref:YicC/YloC family endoribonuclease n=1 Tax=Caenispirillum salinarum TaxID=859058 RepID=UPI00384F2465